MLLDFGRPQSIASANHALFSSRSAGHLRHEWADVTAVGLSPLKNAGTGLGAQGTQTSDGGDINDESNSGKADNIQFLRRLESGYRYPSSEPTFHG